MPKKGVKTHASGVLSYMFFPAVAPAPVCGVTRVPENPQGSGEERQPWEGNMARLKGGHSTPRGGGE